MTASRLPAPLPLLLIGLAVLCAALVLIPWVVQAQSQEVSPTVDPTGANPPAPPMDLQASAAHDSVTLTWTASTDQTVTHHAILRRNPDVDASQVFHVIESNAGPATSYTDGTASASAAYIYRVKSVSPTGVSRWSGYVKADTPAAPDPTPTPAPTPTPEPDPESTPVDLAPSNLTAALAEDGGVALTWSAPAEDADSVTGYQIQRTVGQGEMAALVADTASTATSYTDATATDAGETYAYQVKAIRGSDESQSSGQAQVQVPHDPVDLAPSNLTAALAEDGGVNLSWSAPAEDADAVDGYQILRRRPMEGETTLATLVADTESRATTHTDATANGAGVVYVYRVKARRGDDVSLWSNPGRIELPSDYEAPQEDEPGSVSEVLTTEVLAQSRDTGDDSTLGAGNGDPAGIRSDDMLTRVGRPPIPREWIRDEDFALHSENADPKSIWSDGETLWVGDDAAAKVFAYRLWDNPGTEASEYGTRDPGRDVPGLGQEDFHVTGHGPRLYVAEEALDGASRDVFGYDLASLTRLEDRDFVYGGPDVAGGLLIVRGMATDGRHMWITDTTAQAHAFRLLDDPETPGDEYGRPDTSRRLTIPGSGQLTGLFTDGRTMWGVRFGSQGASVRSVKLSDGTGAGYDFPLREENDHAYGLWSDGETFYVVDADDGMIYTYHGISGVVRRGVEEAETAAALVGNTTQSGDAGHDLGSAGAKRAQAFTTGNNNAGYALASIGIDFGDVSDPSSAPSDLEVTLNADGGGVPGDALCTLVAPASLSERSVNTFAVPASGTTCPALVKETTYFVVVERVRATASGTIAVSGAASGSEDTGAAEGWSIADGSAAYSSQSDAPEWASDAFSYRIEVRGSLINSPATGLPTISGTPEVGQTIAADTSDIDDADGLTNVSYSYQWLAGGSDINGATGSSHELTSSEQGQTIQVRVTFADDGDNAETRTSVATEAVAAAPNRETVDQPTISGTPQVGETLTAGTSDIVDEDGLENVSYSYQWLADGVNIDGATGSTYVLADGDAGKTIKVSVSFADDRGNAETRTSEATATVDATVPTQPLSLTVATRDRTQELVASWQAPSYNGGSAVTGYRVQWKEAADSWDTQADVSEATVTGTIHTITGLTGGVEYSVRVIATNIAGDSAASTEAKATPAGVISEQTTEAENSAPTGLPTVGGTPQVDRTLTASTSDIDDADGLTNVSYSYQWIAAGTDIDGATGSSYELTSSEQGQTIQVRVSFTDDEGNDETLTSVATVAVAAAPNLGASGKPRVGGTPQVDRTLTASTSDIDDADGLTNVSYRYQWIGGGIGHRRGQRLHLHPDCQ